MDEYAKVEWLPDVEKLASMLGGNDLAFDCTLVMLQNLGGDLYQKL